MKQTSELIGSILDEDMPRDAIHVAVAPVVAAETLRPGQHAGPGKDGRFASTLHANTIGIVDPFLFGPVNEGQRFWLFLYPNTITSLKHEWTHPAFEDGRAEPSEEWLRGFADRVGVSYGALIDAAKSHMAGNSDGYRLPSDIPNCVHEEAEEFWRHYEAVTGEKGPNNRTETFFWCSC